MYRQSNHRNIFTSLIAFENHFCGRRDFTIGYSLQRERLIHTIYRVSKIYLIGAIDTALFDFVNAYKCYECFLIFGRKLNSEHKMGEELICFFICPFIDRSWLYNRVIIKPGVGEPDPGRTRKYCSYMGLVPSEQSSGERVYSTHIQPRCNRHLRPLLIEAAWTAIRRCPVLLAYYKKHLGTNNKKAIVKVARKLALIAKAVALKKQLYQADYSYQINR